MSNQNTTPPTATPNAPTPNAPVATGKTSRSWSGQGENTLTFFEPRSAGTGIEVGGGISVGQRSIRRILAMAALAPTGSTDPVDRALLAAAHVDLRGRTVQTVEAKNFSPATPERHYSIARAPHFEYSKGQFADMIILRGDLDAVMNATQPSRETRTILRMNAQAAGARGYRSLTIATARLNPDGTREPFQIEGFINVRPAGTGAASEEDTNVRPEHFMRLSLWSPLLRTLHWVNVFLIFILSLTGYYIMDPFFGPSFFAGVDTGYLMGWMRLIHFTAGFTWLAVGAVRVVLAFTSKDRYMRWATFWPLKSKQDLIYLKEVLLHYLFLRKEGPLFVAHNPMQQLTYTALYAVGFFQMLTGLSLYSLYHQTNPVWEFLALPCHWLGVPAIRLIHVMIMFFFWAFVIAHIYLAFRADSIERHGGISSMISGGVWLRKGSKPVDAPEM